MRKLIVIVLLLVLVGAALQAKKIITRNPGPSAPPSATPAVAVAVVTARQESWLPSISATGSLRAYQGVDVTAQESGMITGIYFESGRKVRRGELLLQQYDADEQYTLKGLKAELDLARKSFERSQDLIGNKAVSQSQLDVARSDLERLSAQVESLEVSIAKRAIRAPFDGVLGIRKVNVGQYIEPGDAIVTLQALDPVYVDFRLPQNRLAQAQIGHTVKIGADAYPGEEFSGKVDAIEPLVDPETRSFEVEARIPNPDLKLRPGMFVEARMLLPVREKVLTLPQAAISYHPYGDSVFVIESAGENSDHAGLTAKNVYVTLGDTRGDQIAVLSGLEAGQRVVIAGQLRLQNGTPVVVDNSIAVGNSPDPSVENN